MLIASRSPLLAACHKSLLIGLGFAFGLLFLSTCPSLEPTDFLIGSRLRLPLIEMDAASTSLCFAFSAEFCFADPSISISRELNWLTWDSRALMVFVCSRMESWSWRRSFSVCFRGERAKGCSEFCGRKNRDRKSFCQGAV